MIRGLSRIVPNVVVVVWLAMAFLPLQPAAAEEKPKAAARQNQKLRQARRSALRW